MYAVDINRGRVHINRERGIMTNLYDNLYDDPTLLQDPDYTKLVCGVLIHVDDVESHIQGVHGIEGPCEDCDAKGS